MYERLQYLFEDDLSKIINKTILIIGIGGVGSYALETLTRTGIKKLIIVDSDKIDETNLNRQLMSLNDNIGNYKTDIFENRIKKINRDCLIIKHTTFITKDNLESLFKEKIDYVIDACDTLDTKKEIIKYCLKNKIKFISCMGMANRIDSSLIKQTTLDKTFNDPLSKKLRFLLRKENIKGKIPVIFSQELPKKSDKLGTVAHVPATAVILITNYIINDILKEK